MLSILLLILVLILSCGQINTPSFENEWAFTSFEKVDSINPILLPSDQLSFQDPIDNQLIKWEARNVLNPTALIYDNKVYLLYRAQDSSGTSRIGLAISEDGLHFSKQALPVLFPDNDSMKIYEWNYQKNDNVPDNTQNLFDGVEDPRIMEAENGTYIMTYTAYDGKTARLCLASSTDLLHWNKHGLLLQDEKYRNLWSKSGAIIGSLQENKIVAKKILGKYWMYFGDTDLFMATSDDLLHWQAIVDDESGKMISVLHPRAGYFDSRLVEPGPFALYTEKGIVLIYNASNAANLSDPALPKFTYAAGQALYDKLSPWKLIDRSKNYFIHPDKDYEKMGEVNEVCFVEGLVHFKDRWFLYYGTADSKIAVAISSNSK
ncbi:MAG: glycoside hydrolase family 130 protein [Saprospiraceae bacterium]